jgi:hypothetical protein
MRSAVIKGTAGNPEILSTEFARQAADTLMARRNDVASIT